MKKDWRQTQWKDFTLKQKKWFFLLCILLVLIIVMACLSTAEVMIIPDWLTILIVTITVISLCKFLQLTPWAFMNYGDEQEDDNE